ncbi:prepilin peptidase dependent protein C precursor [Salmonella enterica subsp. enterica]|nr:prepilin peptidase dependent protein C precursor [Salmonella enterica subsp. enterica]
MSHPLNLQRGFSLPEVLVAMVLMVMIVTALSRLSAGINAQFCITTPVSPDLAAGVAANGAVSIFAC